MVDHADAGAGMESAATHSYVARVHSLLRTHAAAFRALDQQAEAQRREVVARSATRAISIAAHAARRSRQLSLPIRSTMRR